MPAFDLPRRLAAEFLGTGTLVCTVVGSGIMGERLAGGNTALALLGNTLPTGAMLTVLILILGPISGAHMNPAVSLAMAWRRELPSSEAGAYVLAQLLGGICGALTAHLMFDLPLLQFGTKVRTGLGQWTGELVATFGLLATILGCSRFARAAIAPAVGLYITAAYWFTSSTSFANPAVTLARALSDTFAGIRPVDLPAFWVAQLAGAAAAVLVFGWILEGRASSPTSPSQGRPPAETRARTLDERR
ncbi:MAG: MIP family protein [Geminicoccaceae bacterium]|nr:MAG: MIP family protein [Geminicoccaceae bacterium]